MSNWFAAHDLFIQRRAPLTLIQGFSLAPVLNGFGNVFGFNGFAVFKIGDGSGHFQNSVRTSAAPP